MDRAALGRVAWVALAAWGAALATRPTATVRAVCGDVPVPPSPVVRVLGGRQVLQSLLLLTLRRRVVATGGAAVDGVHAATMLAAAYAWPHYRRPALTSAAVATASAAVTAAARR